MLQAGAMSHWCPALAIDHEGAITMLRDDDILDDEDEGPTSLDHEALTDDAC